MTRSAESDLAAFESHRALLVAHAYRMLGDLARAEDIVQDAWLKWAGPHEAVISARAYLVTLVTRLCLNELDSARSRREESRGDRLPEPADLKPELCAVLGRVCWQNRNEPFGDPKNIEVKQKFCEDCSFADQPQGGHPNGYRQK